MSNVYDLLDVGGSVNRFLFRLFHRNLGTARTPNNLCGFLSYGDILRDMHYVCDTGLFPRCSVNGNANLAVCASHFGDAWL